MTADQREQWLEFKTVDLPAAARDVEVNGLSLVFLAEDVAALLDAYFANDWSFDTEQTEQFGILVDDLAEVVSSTGGEVRDYFVRLQSIAVAIAE